MTCHEQITKMCFLLRCQLFPLPVTDGSQCYYRNRLIFLMSHFNRLRNLTVAAHPCQTICTNQTFTETTKLCCQTAMYSIKFHIVEQDIQVNNQRRGNAYANKMQEIYAKSYCRDPYFLGSDKIPKRYKCIYTTYFHYPSSYLPSLHYRRHISLRKKCSIQKTFTGNLTVATVPK